jgi:hypothetical protein
MSIASISAVQRQPTSIAAPTPTAPTVPSAPASSAGSSAAAAQWLTNYASETPAQHMRDSTLSSMGYTEADLKAMDPKKRQAVEDELAKKLKDQALNQTQNQQKKGVLLDIQA